MKYKEYSEEAYQSILSYVMKSVEIDENDPYIKRLYIAAARVPKFSIEYSCEDISHIMLKIEKAVWAWEKENTEGDFFVDGGENWWMVKNQVGTFTYTTNRLFMDICDIKGIKELVKDVIDKYRVIILANRYVSDYELLQEYCDYYLRKKKNIVIISCHSSDSDALDVRYAQDRGYELDIYPVDRETNGGFDGFDYNSQMIVNADGLIVLWDGFNRKVKNVIEKAWEYDIEPYEFKI